jgi:hypothetical protein
MGALFGMQRRLTGGIQAPVLTHVTWSALMLRFLPPLFADRSDVHQPAHPRVSVSATPQCAGPS